MGYTCGSNGSLDCTAAGITSNMNVTAGTGPVELKDCVYSNCQTIFVGAGASLTLRNVTFRNIRSFAAWGVGAIYVEGGSLTANRVRFMSTSGIKNAAALWAEQATVDLTDVTMESLASLGFAGGAFFTSSTLTALRLNCTNVRSVNGNGACIYIYTGSVASMTVSTFVGNISPGSQYS